MTISMPPLPFYAWMPLSASTAALYKAASRESNMQPIEEGRLPSGPTILSAGGSARHHRHGETPYAPRLISTSFLASSFSQEHCDYLPFALPAFSKHLGKSRDVLTWCISIWNSYGSPGQARTLSECLVETACF